MKKLVLGAAIAMSSLTFAQQFGIKAGMNVSSLSKDAGLDDSKSKIGFNAGLFMNAPLGQNFSIQPEILYNNLGDKVSYKNLAGNEYASVARNLDYIAVPVMFQYNATPEFYLEAGPEFGFLVNAKVKTDNSVLNTTTISSLDTDAYKDFNMGIGLGAGYYFTPKIGLTARYVAGLTDVYSSNNGDKVKNNNFQVGLAYKF